ncbi:MAG: methyltransferase domain-containing protein, partial [Thermoanaerobaculia bacterium]
MKYEKTLAENDRRLKQRELDAVRLRLEASGRWGSLRRYLDIGTCTGRYVLALREALRSDGEIFGIDNDRDCVAFAEKNVEEQATN